MLTERREPAATRHWPWRFEKTHTGHVVDLYALPPEEFTAARDSAAKRDPTLKALRRPTVSAWLVNLLVRREPTLVEQLLSLGVRLAQAQRSGAAGALRDLGAQRRALVEAVVGRSLELGARSTTPATKAEVLGTLEAALADGDSAAALRSGRLVRPLSYAGFGAVDLAGAVAPAEDGAAGAPAPEARTRSQRRPPLPRPSADASTAPGRSAVAAAERAAQEAAGALDDAVRTAEQARHVADEARCAAQQAAQQERTAAHRVAHQEEGVQAARQALAAAVEALTGRRDEQRQVETDVAAAEQAEAQAVTALTRAQCGAAAARKTLDQRRRGT